MGRSKKLKPSDVVPIPVRIYAICKLSDKNPIKVSLDFEEIDFEFELEGYDEKEYAIMSFDVVLI